MDFIIRILLIWVKYIESTTKLDKQHNLKTMMLPLLVTTLASLETLNLFTEAKELRVLGMLPLTGDGWRGGGVCLPATQMAVEDVNAHDGLLPGYNLTYEWIDSKVKNLPLLLILYKFGD